MLPSRTAGSPDARPSSNPTPAVAFGMSRRQACVPLQPCPLALNPAFQCLLWHSKPGTASVPTRD